MIEHKSDEGQGEMPPKPHSATDSVVGESRDADIPDSDAFKDQQHSIPLKRYHTVTAQPIVRIQYSREKDV
jgi:hypothetical protein